MTNEILVSAPQNEILVSTKQRILALAGQGGGKSHMAGLISADFVINYPQAKGFIGANTYQQLSKSTLDRVFNVWKETFGWVNGREFVVNITPPKRFVKTHAKLESYDKTICFDNGAIIFTASLDNYKAIDGTQFTWAILDETKDTKEEAVKEVITGRLREKSLWVKDGIIITDETLANELGAEGWNPLYILTSPAKVYWINEWFELSDKYDKISERIISKTDYYSLETEDKKIVIYSAYHNEHNLPKNFIEQRKKDLAGNQNRIEMLIYGSPIAKAGGELYKRFDRLTHVRDIEKINGLPIHISLDFNRVPYIVMTCWQIVVDGSKYKAQCFDEITLSSPKNTTEELCKEFIFRHLSGIEKPPAIFYYGDATGNTVRDTVGHKHNFNIVDEVMRRYLNDNSKRVLKGNLSVANTVDFVNKIFYGGIENIEMIIGSKCKKLILDFEFLKEDPNGGKLIEKTKDEVTGQSCEKYGHASDAARYFIVSAFKDFYKPK